ncbi:MAG: ATP-binding cassette domain-containing protein [Opitutales bacterium]
MIEISNLSKSYPAPEGDEVVEVFSGVNLSIEKGASVAIVGPSGSGKSTLLNVIGLLDKATEGELEVDQKKLNTLSEQEVAHYRNQTVGFVFQSHHLLPSCTVLENVMIPALAGFGSLQGEALENRATKLLEEVGIGHRANHLSSQISGGERQRVAVARALVNEPSVLLADEPTGALDKKNTDHLIDLLKQLNEQRKLTLLMVTHSLEGSSQMKQFISFERGDLNAGEVMSPWKLIFKNLLFFRRQNTGIILAATLCGMVLTGSLTVGDSVRSTLRALAEVRIGEGDLAMLSPDGFFREDLAERIKEELPDEESVVAPIVLSRGMLTSPDGATRVSNIQVLGVDPRFWKLAPDSKLTPTGNESIEKGVSNWGTETFFVNERLGKRLKSETGERLILRMEEPSLFSRDAPLSGERDSKFVSMNKEFGGIIPPEGFGNFGLLGNQREPLTLFVSLSELQKKLFRSLDEATQSTNFANFLLLGIPGDKEIDLEKAKIAMDSCWTLEDAGIEIKKLRESDEWSVRTRQVFLSDSLVDKAKEEQPKASGVLTYLVNAIEKIEEGNKSSLIPYSMISGVAPDKVEFLSNQWKDHHIALNQWAATDLNASIGDSIRISFYTVGERRKLIEASRSFELQKILPMPKTVPEDQESDWTPRFPGLSDADSCGEWDTGIPIVHEVRVRDEDYWDEFRGSPKAFVSLKAAQEMWGNRWGSLTGIRANRKNLSREELGSQLRQNLKAEDAGLIIQSLRSDARESVETPVDFGQLFMGFSFFVIVAVLAITGMLFSFSMQQRNQQVGLLRALGWKPGKIRLVFWGEGALAAIMGSLLGVLLAASYGKLILDLLSGEWSGAVSGASFVYDARVFSMVIGWVSSATICFVAMVWSTRKQIKKEPRELLMSGNQGWNHGLFDRKRRNGYRWVGWICLVSAVGLASGVGLSSGMASMTFFGAGALFLIGGLFLFRAQLGKLIQRNQKLSEIKELNQRNLGRRAGRSLVTVGSMAAGAFLVVSTGAFRKSAPPFL